MARPLVATYRVQLHAGFGFDQLAAVVGYMAELGVSHLYLSPCLQARSGSTHGYDVVDPTRFDQERGGSAGFELLQRACAERGLGLVLDVVPNHMAASLENPWWRDVLEHGRASRHASWFDVDWTEGPIVLPILDGPLGKALEEHRLRLERRGGRIVLLHGEQELPVALAPLSDELRRAARAAGSEALAALAEDAHAATSTADRERAVERLAVLLGDEPATAAAVDERLRQVSASASALAEVLEGQAYRPSPWRKAPAEVSYRRFFDIHELVGLRVEDPAVFEATHALILELVRSGAVDGLRIDHVDGLLDPEGYLQRLRHETPGAHLWVEKILAPCEHLPATWPVDGTTGYELVRLLDGLLVDPEGEELLTLLHAEFTGETRDFHTIALEARREVLDQLFPAELERLARHLALVAERRFRPLEDDEARAALREVLASLRVYRTYVRPNGTSTEEDRRRMEEAVDDALERRRELDPLVFEFLRDLLLLRWPGPAELLFVLRFQQLAPAVAAKGVEDTALYRYGRLLALNEVGGDPAHFGIGVDELHQAFSEIQRTRPLQMHPGSTHDTKRSEDVRVRLIALTEMPDRWTAAVRRWSEHHAQHGQAPPDRAIEYLIYQTIAGAYPIDVERVTTVVLKSAREAKRHTSWLRPDEAYEAELRASIQRMLEDPWFVRELDELMRSMGEVGRVNSLARLLVQLTAPGVPDLYQGAAFWNPRLVDPDNRADVDFDLFAARLEELEQLGPEAVLDRAESGMPKLLVVRRALALRRELPQCFGPEGSYEPLEARGPKRSNVFAFARGGAVATVVPRLSARRGKGWEATTLRLPPGPWRDVLTGADVAGGEIELEALLARFPVALLRRAESDGEPA